MEIEDGNGRFFRELQGGALQPFRHTPASFRAPGDFRQFHQSRFGCICRLPSKTLFGDRIYKFLFEPPKYTDESKVLAQPEYMFLLAFNYLERRRSRNGRQGFGVVSKA